MSRRKPRMSFRDAMDIAEAMDLPEGAFWAISHELAGLDYGDGFAELEPRRAGPPSYTVSKKLRACIEQHGELRQCDAYHWQVRAGRIVVADWWPHKRKFRIKGDAKTTQAGLDRAGHEKAFLKALAERGPRSAQDQSTEGRDQ